MSTDNLTRRTLSGLKWTYAQAALSAVLLIVMAGVMARLVSPAAFGLIAIGNLSLRFVNYFARAGITEALIQKPDLRNEDIRAGFTAGTALGVGFSAIVWVGAPVLETFFDASGVVRVVRLMGLNLLLFGLGSTAESLLRRELRFKSLAIRDTASYLIGYVAVGLPMAAAGAGVDALIAAMLIQTGSKSLLAYLAVRHPIRPTMDREAHRAVLSFGGRVSLISFLEFLGTELDTFAVGRYAGASPLGLYNRAYLLVRLPIYHLATNLSRVLYPALASVQNELDRLRGAYRSAMSVTASVLIPTAAGIAVAGNELILVILGRDWAEAAQVTPWIALATALSMVTHFAALTAEAKAELNYKIGISVVEVLVLAGLLLLAAGQPLWAYGAALAGSALFRHVAYLRLMQRILERRWWTILSWYLPSILTGGLVAAAIFVVRKGLIALGAPLVAVFVAEATTGAVVLLITYVVGPLRSIRYEAGRRLAHAGLLASDSDRRIVVLLRRWLIAPDGRAAESRDPDANSEEDGRDRASADQDGREAR